MKKVKQSNVSTAQEYLNVVKEIVNVNNSGATSEIENLQSRARTRNIKLSQIDAMSRDSTISAVLRTYAQDISANDGKGEIVKIICDDDTLREHLNYLKDMLNVDKQIYKWGYSLTKYGDVYVEVIKDVPKYSKDDALTKKLNEALKIALTDNLNGTYRIETYDNPCEMFELVQNGKTIMYVKAPITDVYDIDNYDASLITYNYQYSNDVEIYPPNRFVHASIEDGYSRINETINLRNSDGDNYRFKVRSGISILNDAYETWRYLSILEDSVLLNRVSKSATTKLFQVDLPSGLSRDKQRKVCADFKSLLEGKTSLNKDKYISDYNNPGPLENIVVWAKSNGKGGIEQSVIGGDVNVGQLTDLEYQRDKLFATLLVPKQFFGFVSDNAGFSGGQSLSIISSRYGKAVNSTKASICYMVQDLLNTILYDEGRINDINKFTVYIEPAVTQEDIDKREDVSTKLRNVSDILNIINADITNPSIKLKVVKNLLGEVLSNDAVSDAIQEQIDEYDAQATPEDKSDDVIDNDMDLDEKPSPTPTRLKPEVSAEERNENTSNEVSNVEINDETNDENDEDYLPTPEELGVDMTK